jgi:predicted amidohydrolase
VTEATPPPDLTVALIHEVFFGDGAQQRLGQALRDARAAGATLAILPELPLDPWVPHAKTPDGEDAETPGGRRHTALAQAAQEAGIGVVGGAITIDAHSGRRHNRALIFDAAGQLVDSYDKLHVPDEEGFWEAAHYEVGHRRPGRIDAFGTPVGVQLCSDMYRPQVSQYLGALGVVAILAPRATETTTFDRWRAMLQSNAVTSCAFVVSANRPRPEFDVPLGSPSTVVCPDGRVLVETTEMLTTVTLAGEEIAQARQTYPGYLPVRADIYARCWGAVGSADET